MDGLFLWMHAMLSTVMTSDPILAKLLVAWLAVLLAAWLAVLLAAKLAMLFVAW